VAEDVLRLGRRFPEANARGATGWSPSAFRLLSIPAAAELAALLNDVWISGILPSSAVATLVAFIPKASGGHRPIQQYAALIRTWRRVRQSVIRSWRQGCTAARRG
jgi:hypothetical protein